MRAGSFDSGGRRRFSGRLFKGRLFLATAKQIPVSRLFLVFGSFPSFLYCMLHGPEFFLRRKIAAPAPASPNTLRFKQKSPATAGLFCFIRRSTNAGCFAGNGRCYRHCCCCGNDPTPYGSRHAADLRVAGSDNSCHKNSSGVLFQFCGCVCRSLC